MLRLRSGAIFYVNFATHLHLLYCIYHKVQDCVLDISDEMSWSLQKQMCKRLI